MQRQHLDIGLRCTNGYVSAPGTDGLTYMHPNIGGEDVRLFTQVHAAHAVGARELRGSHLHREEGQAALPRVIQVGHRGEPREKARQDDTYGRSRGHS